MRIENIDNQKKRAIRVIIDTINRCSKSINLTNGIPPNISSKNTNSRSRQSAWKNGCDTLTVVGLHENWIHETP